MNAGEPKTVERQATIPERHIDANLPGTTERTEIGERIAVLRPVIRAGSRQGARAGEFKGAERDPIEVTTMFEFELLTAGPVEGRIAERQMPLPKTAVEDPESTGTAKWKMIGRETRNG
jgi:hypothetical protein